jgi:hypothetical protein
MIQNAKAISMIVMLATAICTPAIVAAQPVVVVGTGDPNLDVPAVQDAVDQGGQVFLMGNFSFDMPPTKPDGATYNRMVTVSRQVVISGYPDESGDTPAIEGGFVPFYVEANGARVVIQGLRFVRPTGAAIWVYAASGLVIAGCRIEDAEPSGEFMGLAHPYASPIFITSTGQPENFSGTLWISNNDIDVGGTAGDQTTGIYIDGVGKSPDKEVDLYIFGNNIRNITDSVIDVKSIGGRVHIERNVIATGAISLPIGLKPQAINVVGSGSYLIAHNSIVSQWATGTGITVQGNPGLSEESSIVVDNDVTMSAPDGTVFGSNSAGIMILGFAQGNAVLNNRIRGRARAALAVGGKGGGIPANNTFVMNDLAGFQPSLADIFVDAGVTNTLVVARKGTTIADHGVGTVAVPMP